MDSVQKLTSPQIELLYKSSFVMLLSYFDFLISDLIHFYYQNYPLSLPEKLSMTLNELRDCKDISEAVDFIVNKEVESVLYKNIDDQKKYFEGTLKIECYDNIVIWSKIKEAVLRRNIIVHNNSFINKRYMQNVERSIISHKNEQMKEGDPISVDEMYFNSVLDEIYLVGVILIQCCWRKWKKVQLEHIDDELNEIIYQALFDEKWSVAEKLGLFSKKCDVFNESSRLFFNINYAISLKWQNKKTELEKELNAFDVSSLCPKFKLAYYALKSDKVNFYKCIKDAITTDKLTIHQFYEWPLLREFRKDPKYENKIKAVFSSLKR